MHSCPECGQACYCGGDIDDCEMEGNEAGCVHKCDPRDFADEDYDEDMDDEYEPLYYHQNMEARCPPRE